MRDVGSALRWVMWQSNRQLVLDLEDVRVQKDDSTACEHVQRRRSMAGPRSSRRYRRSLVPMRSSADGGIDNPVLSGSELGEEMGGLISGSDSESSEAEWQGWMADLFRQQKVQAQAKRVREEAAAVEKLVDLDEGDRIEPPRTPAEDRRHQIEKRRALEPIGIVTTMYSNTPPSSTGTVLSLSSSFWLLLTTLALSSFHSVNHPLLALIYRISVSLYTSTYSQLFSGSCFRSILLAWTFSFTIDFAPRYL